MRRVLITLALAVAFGCEQQTAPVAHPVGLWNTAWKLEDLGGIGVIADAEAMLEFPEAGQGGRRGGCNRFFAIVAVTGETIRFTASDRRAWPVRSRSRPRRRST